MRIPFAAVFAGVCFARLAIPTSSAAVTVEVVDVGVPGNPNDSTGYGGVPYSFAIGKYEVTLEQYAAFLNAVAPTDTYGLWNSNMQTWTGTAGIARSGISGNYSYSVIGSGQRPVTWVGWFEAARFVNWLHNGQPTGAQNATSTEDGAYSLRGARFGVITKNNNSRYWIPSENEWYKAAYYQPAALGGDTDGYWGYPTKSNSAPGNVVGNSPNQANYRTNDRYPDGLTVVGAFSLSAGPYGTFDQGGNVRELNDPSQWSYLINESDRGPIRGGGWDSGEIALAAATRSTSSLGYASASLGFRIAAANWNAANPPPTIVTRVPANCTQASAILRAEVNPNGLPTTVEFFLDRISKGVVNAGDGRTPTIIELRVGGLPPGLSSIIDVKTTNASGESKGVRAQLVLKSTREKENSFAGPMVLFLPISNVTEHGALLDVEANPNGYPTNVRLFLSDGNESTLPEVGSKAIGGGDAPVRVQVAVGGLYRGHTYTARVQADARLPDGHGVGGASLEPQVFTTLGEPGHNPPQTANVALRVPIGSTASFTHLVEGFDPDGDSFSIESISAPQHGTVTVFFMEWTYVPDATYDGADQFSVTIVDASGEKATALVQIYDVHPGAFEFDLGLDWNVSDPPRPAGRLKLSATTAGSFTGRASIFGADYVLRGAFDRFNEAVLELDRPGLPPLVATFKLEPQVDGEMHLSAEIHAPELGSSYVAEGLPVGNAETGLGVTGLRYTTVLPMQGDDTATPEGNPSSGRMTGLSVIDELANPQTPRGDGFLIGLVGKSGRARFAGQTGDGQTFTFGGKLQRNRQLKVGLSVGGQPPDYIVGYLQFERDQLKTVGGSLGWLSYRAVNEYYSRDFVRVATPTGAAYHGPKPAMNLFGDIGLSTNLRLQLLSDLGTSLLDSVISVNRAGDASLAGDHDVRLHFDRKSGFFRGTFKTSAVGSKNLFSGALVQPLKRGGGHLLMQRTVGAVSVAAPQ